MTGAPTRSPIFACGFLFPSAMLFAQEPTDSELLLSHEEEIEQLQTNTAYVIEPGEVELDVVPSFLKFRDRDEYGLDAELEYGFSDRLMFEVEVSYRRIDPELAGKVDGVGNPEIEGKYLLFDRGDRAAAINLGIELPVGDDTAGIGTKDWALIASIPLSFQFPERNVSLHVELGAEWEEGEGIAEMLTNAALEYRPAARNVAFQLGGNFLYGDGKPVSLIIAGFEVAAEGLPFQIGMGLPVGLSDEAPDWGMLFDIEFEF